MCVYFYDKGIGGELLCILDMECVEQGVWVFSLLENIMG